MNEERLNKLLEDIDNALYDLKICQCNINVTAKGHKWETYYGLDDDLIKYIRKIESSNKNLQSKIDKAIEFVESMKYCGQEDYFYDNKSEDPCGNDNTFDDSKNKLLDILKENK